MQNLAEVRLWGQQVGALSYQANTQLATFEYAPSWINSGIQIAPIHMPLGKGRYQYPSLPKATYRGLPSIFADTLPDDFGNAVINAWLARQGRDAASFNPIERLLYTGERGMGALEFAPAVSRNASTHDLLELDSLIEMAQQVLDQRSNSTATLRDDAASEMQSLFQVGTSAGGARAKALVAINAQRSKIVSGQSDAPKGFQHYLLKFDGVVENNAEQEVFGDPMGYGRMEYAYYLMAKDAGINISPSELLIDGQRAHFITQRFDRKGNRKLHYASLCAMDHADYKQAGAYSYEQLLAVARQLRLPRADAVEIFRRMVFNVVARNHDDHTKNTGFILESPEASWRLAPAFDIAYSYKPGSSWVNAHQMSLNGKRDNFTYEDLTAVASLIGNFSKQAKGIIAEIVEVVSNWHGYAQRVQVFDDFSEQIGKTLRLTL